MTAVRTFRHQSSQAHMAEPPSHHLLRTTSFMLQTPELADCTCSMPMVGPIGKLLRQNRHLGNTHARPCQSYAPQGSGLDRKPVDQGDGKVVRVTRNRMSSFNETGSHKQSVQLAIKISRPIPNLWTSPTEPFNQLYIEKKNRLNPIKAGSYGSVNQHEYLTSLAGDYSFQGSILSSTGLPWNSSGELFSMPVISASISGLTHSEIRLSKKSLVSLSVSSFNSPVIIVRGGMAVWFAVVKLKGVTFSVPFERAQLGGWGSGSEINRWDPLDLRVKYS